MRVPDPVRKIAVVLAALVAGTVLWLPCLGVLFRADPDDYLASTGLAPRTRALAERQFDLWSADALRSQEVAKMRKSNPEWDFMGRTYLSLSLANIALREPAQKKRCLEVMDRIIADTIRLEKEQGKHYFLLDYSRHGRFVSKHQRSLFEDGEIALMLAVRRMVEERADYVAPLAERAEWIVRTMQESPVLCGESYPNECWMFCNLVALVSLRMHETLDGADHSAFIGRWLDTARRRLVHPATGLLISSFAFDGSPYDGPEGSTIWMVAHCLQVLDPAWAKDQYRRAHRELAGNFLGFGYAREWPASWRGPMDVDSGPIIPVLDISAGSSGLAILGAAAFEDRAFLRGLLTSLDYAGFPVEANGRLKYCASNQVGDAVLLYAMVQGPLWREVLRRGKATRPAGATGSPGAPGAGGGTLPEGGRS